jgi:hypothetical protein
MPHAFPVDHRLQRAFASLDKELNPFCQQEKLDSFTTTLEAQAFLAGLARSAFRK